MPIGCRVLRLADRYPTTVPRRGRPPIPFTSEIIYVTSTLPPEAVYHNLAAGDTLAKLNGQFNIIEMFPDTHIRVK